jgi:hypothetical protein
MTTDDMERSPGFASVDAVYVALEDATNQWMKKELKEIKKDMRHMSGSLVLLSELQVTTFFSFGGMMLISFFQASR